MTSNRSQSRSLKMRLAALIHPIERVIDRIKNRPAKDPVILPYVGYATPQNVIFRGRVLARKDHRQAHASDSRIANFLQMLRLFATDEVAEVAVTGGGTSAMTDEEGYFSLMVPRDAHNGWVSIDAHLEEYATPPVQLKALVAASDARFGIISDIDDTVMETGAYSLLKNLWTSLTGNSLTRHIYPDARDLLNRLHDGQNPVYYVSSSPWNMFGFLQTIFKRNDVPDGPKFLRDLGISETQFITGTHGGHKGAAIDTILAANPDLPFVLLGDTGQEDAHVYLSAHQRHPGRIVKVALREPGPGPDDASRAAIESMKNAGLSVQTGVDFSQVTLPELPR